MESIKTELLSVMGDYFSMEKLNIKKNIKDFLWPIMKDKKIVDVNIIKFKKKKM